MTSKNHADCWDLDENPMKLHNPVVSTHLPWITIVSGLPRSGTSLMMQMLAAGGIPPFTDGIRAPDDDNIQGYFEVEKAKHLKTDSSWVSATQGKALKIISLLLYDLPPHLPYRIIFMQRDMREILASQRRMMERRGTTSSGPSDEEMGTYFKKHLCQVLQWIKHQQIPIFVCDYNSLLTDPSPVLHSLAVFLEGSVNPLSMLKIIDPGLYRNRLPCKSMHNEA